MQRLQSYYIKEIVPIFQAKFIYKNINQVPKITKIVINRGFDESCQSSKVLEVLINELSLVAGQKPVVVSAKKAIAGFKVKENMPVSMFLTLRGSKMYSFLDRLINLALPRIRDFQGLPSDGFDGFGNYNIGLNEQIMFPELDFDKIIKVKGMDITIVTSANSDEEAFFLLSKLGLPFNN